jgi:CRP/FNR family transcriptional regulator, anaerobic regulatory protein
MDVQSIKVACSSCNLRELCPADGPEPEEMRQARRVISTRRRIKRGSALFNTGDKFTSLYAVRTGFFKTCVTTADGRDQVTGFQMTGEIIGLDGIVSDHHTCDAIALEDAEVCVMPFDQLEDSCRASSPPAAPRAQDHEPRDRARPLGDAAAGQHARRRAPGRVPAQPGAAPACARVSQSELILRMTREEIGSYLGMKLETVSRTFSKFVDDGIIDVKQRYVHIKSTDGLKQIVNPQTCR